jgi:hypothetical protein
MIDYNDLRRLAGGKNIADAACPMCGPKARSPHNRIRKVMRIWDDGQGFITYHCERCGESGYAHEKSGGARTQNLRPARPAPASAAAKVEDDKAELVRNLWSWSSNANGTLAETYLRSRHCWIECENIRYLPPRGRHGPTMITRFGEFTAPLTGLHLTRLARNGQGKAGTEKDKIMLGPSNGQPIIVHDNPERGELIVAEGIEDAASWAVATGWTCWAAGAAVRVPKVMAHAKGFEHVYLSLDFDGAGLKALANAKLIRPDLIKIDFNGRDANKVIIAHGASALLIELEHARLRHDYALGKIGRGALQRGLANTRTATF